MRTTNPIESTVATVRHRTSHTRNCLPRSTFLATAFKLIESVEHTWSKIRGTEKVDPSMKGVPFADGTSAIDGTPAPQALTA